MSRLQMIMIPLIQKVKEIEVQDDNQQPEYIDLAIKPYEVIQQELIDILTDFIRIRFLIN